jgi:hypothetical protein
MRRILLLAVLVACSKGEDKSAPGSDPGAGGNSAGTPGKKEKTIKGTLTFGGTLTGSVSGKPDSALTCSCIDENNWDVDTTLTGDNNTIVAIAVNSSNGIKLTGGSGGKVSIVEPLRSEGAPASAARASPTNATRTASSPSISTPRSPARMAR